jgi:cation diffusion facilitator family transporter
MGGAKREFTAKEKLWIGMGMTFGFMLVEAIGGFYARSLAMLGDAAHMLTDAASFGVSLAAIYLSERGPTKNYTFGLARVEVLAALASTMGIWLVTGALVWEAVLRIDEFYAGTAAPVDGKLMVVLGLFGVSMNVLLERVLGGHHPGQHERARFPTSKAPISAIFHSFRLTFGRAIISWNGVDAWMFFSRRARAEHSR